MTCKGFVLSDPWKAATASELILEWGLEEVRPEGPRTRDGVLGEGTASPSPPTRGLRERCKLPQRGPGWSPGYRRVFLYSEPSDCLSQHLSMCCTQFAWLGIRFSSGVYISISPTHE